MKGKNLIKLYQKPESKLIQMDSSSGNFEISWGQGKNNFEININFPLSQLETW